MKKIHKKKLKDRAYLFLFMLCSISLAFYLSKSNYILNSETLYWTFSTLAQVVGAFIAVFAMTLVLLITIMNKEKKGKMRKSKKDIEDLEYLRWFYISPLMRYSFALIVSISGLIFTESLINSPFLALSMVMVSFSFLLNAIIKTISMLPALLDIFVLG